MENTKNNILPATGFLRLPQILAVIPVSKSHWWDGVKSGCYPPSYKLGKNITVWKASDIHELIEGISNRGGDND